MPIYEYLCDDCGAHYERIVMSQKQSITCPKCESAKHTIQLSVFAALANGSKTSGESSSGPHPAQAVPAVAAVAAATD
jgi:putative FmdB family regulatory protein